MIICVTAFPIAELERYENSLLIHTKVSRLKVLLIISYEKSLRTSPTETTLGAQKPIVCNRSKTAAFRHIERERYNLRKYFLDLPPSTFSLWLGTQIFFGPCR